MANKMLIDAAHPEETRVVVTRGNRVEEFDFESASRRQLRGNIYLAKVTRVEPSLQAAFIEYGGNRHGFLAFSEIHPDYYQIPVADRQALIEDDARAEREAEEDERRQRGKRRGARPKKAEGDEAVSAEADAENGDAGENGDDEEIIEQVGGGDALEDLSERPRVARRQYKIQEVIKRRQILLVQVVKEERGNKGAALTTYLSLAGRYSVLMPNTGKGGGISRKITNSEDRKRLKEIAHELEVPDGMGVILRTAGASRTKLEIKRDFEYLMRMWESVRELTMNSTAPALVYEEGSLIKRAIRDLYNKDIDEVLVAGDEGYREAKDFMRMLMPSHAKAVKSYKDPTPLFARQGVDSQLDAMFSNQVTLKSGGYIVINQTEALVAVDVNSGRSTREHNIEDTALKTNLEAAEEMARQLRLRDLAGLIVIDFIDMDEKRNNRSVEKKLKDCLKNDRARIQVGRISPFGLLEMSRQRIRTGVLESSTVVCTHCGGTGFLRATASVALLILRSLEETLLKSATHDMIVRTRTEVALYILNHKRAHLVALEARFGVSISVSADDSHSAKNYFTLDRGEPAEPLAQAKLIAATLTNAVQMGAESEPEAAEAEDEREDEDEIEGAEEEAEGYAPAQHHEGAPREEGENGRKRRRRRRRRGGRNGERTDEAPGTANAGSEETDEAGGDAVAAEGGDAEGETPAPRREDGEGRRRRGRRGGRRNRRDRDENRPEGEASSEDGAQGEAFAPAPEPAMQAVPEEAASVDATPEAAPAKPKRAPRKRKADAAVTEEAAPEAAPEAPIAKAEAPAKPKRAPRKSAKTAPEAVASAEPVAAAEAVPAEPASPPQPKPAAKAPRSEPVTVVLTPPDPDRPKRGGWWAKAKSALGG